MTKIRQPILKSRNLQYKSRNLMELTPESRLHGLESGVRIGVKNLGIGSTLLRGSAVALAIRQSRCRTCHTDTAKPDQTR